MIASIQLVIVKFRWLMVSLGLILGLGSVLFFNSPANSQLASSCAAPYSTSWPASNPVWQMCWKTPENSSGVDGSGLELLSVSYKGKRVFARGHLPILNVKYDPGGCGGSDLSYRDWQNVTVPYEANNVRQADYAEPTTPPVTVCDHPGFDRGTFKGVAVEKRADRLILTTQMQAGWYRYIQKWMFYPDGRIQPQLGFSAVQDPCVERPHNHHAYWRFDFDIDGAANDGVDEFNGTSWTALNTETKRPKAAGRRWRVLDRNTNRGYEIIPAAMELPADSWGIADLWAVRYKGNELDDGGRVNAPNGDQAQLNKFLNGESLNRQDAVIWYRSQFRHAGGLDCHLIGPTLKLVGNW